MLSEQEKGVLFLLEELSASSLPLREQADLVTKIKEALQVLQDELEASELLNPTPSQSSANTSNFVKLCRLRLVGAQKRSLENYKLLRERKTRQRRGDVAEEDVAIEAGIKDPSDDMLAQDVRETKSESITKILQRIHGMAQGEVLKGELNISELEIGSKSLRDLQERYSAVDILLNGSRKLVKVLDEAEKWDRRCMLASLGFLAFVVLYIVYRRILSGPIKMLLWGLFQLVGIAKLVPLPRQPEAMLANPSFTASGQDTYAANEYGARDFVVQTGAEPGSKPGSEPGSDAAAKLVELADRSANALAGNIEGVPTEPVLQKEPFRHDEL